MTRRSRGDGSLYYDRKRGRWVASVDIGRAPSGQRRRRKVSAPTKTKALAELQKLTQELHRTGTVGPRDATVAHVISSYLESPPASWRSSVTVAVNHRHAERIIAGLGRVKLAKLTAGDVERWLHALAREGMSASTLGHMKGLLERAIQRAERDGLVGRNAAAVATLPQARVRKSGALTVADAERLLGLPLDSWWRAYVTVGVMMGLRPGELLGLRWRDVDFPENVLRVRHSAAQGRAPQRGLFLDKLKTDQSRRTLTMPRAATAALRAHKTAQAAARLRQPGWHDLDLVFPRQDGRLSPPNTVRVRFKRLCAEAGIKGDWHPHEMRHTFVSVLSDKGTPIEDIADAAGHINPNITRSVYRHQIADRVSRTSAAMDDIFGTGNDG